MDSGPNGSRKDSIIIFGCPADLSLAGGLLNEEVMQYERCKNSW